ncbi:MAG: undecaprenyl-diphosphatase [Sulfuriferula sp.]
MEHIEAWNRASFLKINAGPGTASWLINSAIFIANDLIYLIPVLLLGLWLWGDEHKRHVALRACGVALFALGINQIIGLFWQHPRPFMIGLGKTWLSHPADSSFPSDHVTVFTSIGICLLLAAETGLGVATVLLGLCVAWARVFLGVHFPMDMIGAAAVAAFSYVITIPLWKKIGNTVTQFTEWLYRSAMARPIARGWIRR